MQSSGEEYSLQKCKCRMLDISTMQRYQSDFIDNGKATVRQNAQCKTVQYTRLNVLLSMNIRM
jgi:hypothetical protein